MATHGILFGLIYLMFSIPLSLLASVDGSPFLSKEKYVVTMEDLENSFDFAFTITNYSQRLEDNINMNVDLEKGSPSHGMFILYRPDRKAVQWGRLALIATKAAVQLINTVCPDYQADYYDCVARTNSISLKETPLHWVCDDLGKICTVQEYEEPYRSADGSCNHVHHGDLGGSYTEFSRFLPAEYSDHIHLPRRARNKNLLPNARLVSISPIERSDRRAQYSTLAVFQWAQFLEHDLSRFASAIMIHSNHSIYCCDEYGFNLPPRYLHPQCFAITIPSNDSEYSEQDIRCMSYVKSLPVMRSDCTLGPKEQVNQGTHYLDGSQIYGTTLEKTRKLRTFVNGQLAFSEFHGKTYPPLSPNPTSDCQVDTENSICFMSGDSRINFQPSLTVMHTLWLREHNRIASGLADLNGQWDDETIFQEARRIVIAEMQHITYHEWISEVLNNGRVSKIHTATYEENSDPRVSNSFASAAMRSFMSMIPDDFEIAVESQDDDDPIRQHGHFNKPEIITRPQVFDSIIMELVTQRGEFIDTRYAYDLNNNYLGNGPYGYDVLSLDIQRSRDHGLPGYNSFRRQCGLKKAVSFIDFQDSMTPENAMALSKVYAHPDDVDLIIGGLMEQQEEESLLGPTLSCLIEDQLERTKKGDRYFYSNLNQPKPFSDSQLEEIRQVTLARIFCDNSDEIKKMQPHVFKKLVARVGLPHCDSDEIPRMSLLPWLDRKER